MFTKTLHRLSPVRPSLGPLAAIALSLILIATSAVVVFAQATPYADPSGQFTASIPEGWADESTPEYGRFSKSGVTMYLLAVDGSDPQSSIDTAVAQLAPHLSSAVASPMGEFPSPSGSWTQVLYSLPSGEVGNAVAQSRETATVVILVTAGSMSDMQSILADANTMLASVEIAGEPLATEAPDDVTADTPAAAGDVTFPALTGPYAVGRITALWSDESRDEAFTAESGDPRVLNIWIWYPSEPAADAAAAPYLTDEMSVVFQQFTGLGPDSVHSHAYAEAPAATTATGYPVLVYSPGNGYNAAFSASLLEEIASHGYIVVGIDHAYNALLTTLPDGQVVMRPDEGTSESEEAFATRLADVTFVIDRLAQVNSGDAILKGSLDLDRVGLIGHSFGGQTAAEACRMDARCQAVAISDVPLRGEVATAGLPQPILLMDTERISGEAWVEEAEQLAGQAMPNAELVADFMNRSWADRDTAAEMLLASSPDAYRVGIDGARHNNFTDMPLLIQAQPALASQLGGIATIAGERGHRVISDYLLAFFGTYLTDEPSPLLEGPSADYPEVTFSRGAR